MRCQRGLVTAPVATVLLHTNTTEMTFVLVYDRKAMCWTFALSGGTAALLTILGAFNIVTCTAFARNLMICHTALADYFMQATYPYRLWAQIILPLLSPVFFCVQLGAWCYLSAADEQIGWCLFAIFLLSGVLVLHGVVIAPQQYRLKSLAWGKKNGLAERYRWHTSVPAQKALIVRTRGKALEA